MQLVCERDRASGDREREGVVIAFTRPAAGVGSQWFSKEWAGTLTCAKWLHREACEVV